MTVSKLLNQLSETLFPRTFSQNLTLVVHT